VLSSDDSPELQPDKVKIVAASVVEIKSFELKKAGVLSMANFYIYNRCNYKLAMKSVNTMDRIRKQCANELYFLNENKLGKEKPIKQVLYGFRVQKLKCFICSA